MDFFDSAFTYSNNVSNVTCCHPDNTPEVLTCGQGASCAGQCSAIGASLCPSGNCTDDPRTCDLEFNDEIAEGEESRKSAATLSGTDLAWCTSDGCRVRKHKGCCYNPNCLRWKGRKAACKWLNYLTGNAELYHSSPNENRFVDEKINFRKDLSIPWQPASWQLDL